MHGLKYELAYRECLVSYLSVPGLLRHVEEFAEDDTRNTFSLARRFTQHYGAETPGGVGEPECFDYGCSGAVTTNIARVRPIGRQAGSVPLVLELLDLLHIQLECLAGELIVRGAVEFDFLRVGPDGECAQPDPALSRPAHLGPALSRAREIHANEAVLPRIAVAAEIVRRLRSDETLWSADHFLRAEVDLIGLMLRVDGSGVHYIDYLRAGLGEFDYDFDRYAAFLGHHKRIVESGLAGSSPWSAPGTYDWLKSYHNERIDDDLVPPDDMARADECDRGMAGALNPLRIA